MKTIRLLIVAVTVLAMTVTAFAREQYVPTGAALHLNVAQMGMGGLTTTIATNAHTPFYNPAMLNRQKFALEINIPFGFKSELLDLANFISDHQDDFTRFDSLSGPEQEAFLKDSESLDDKWFGLQVAPYFGLAFKHFGIGAYQTINAQTKLDQGVFSPAVGLRAYGDFVFGVGYGWSMSILGQDWDVGATFRSIQRRSVAPKRISAADAGAIEDLVATMQEELEESKSGFGIDFGAVRTLELGEPGSGQGLDIAVVLQDAIGSLDGYMKPNLKFGAMYHMPFAGGALLKRWDFGAEYNDFLNREGVSIFQKINLGTEMNMLAGLIKLRGGFHQGYPTYGLGVSLLFLKIDVAKYTTELGTKPGQQPDDLLLFSLTLGW